MRIQLNRFAIVEEPVGSVYRALVQVVTRFCAEALLVVRPSLGENDDLRRTLQRLSGFLLSQEQGSRWPGTVLLGGRTATIYRYVVEPDVVRILQDSAHGLYAWKQPDLPEDLCFLRGDGRALLTSISHENWSELELAPGELQELIQQIPRLRLKLCA